MNKTALPCIATLLLLVASCSLFVESDKKEDSSVYFPLDVGNYWKYRNVNSGEQTISFRIIGTDTIDSIIYFLYSFSEVDPTPDSIRADANGNILRYINGQEIVWFNFNASSGTTYTYRDYVVSVEKNIHLETPTGAFENCIRLYFDDPGADDDELSYTFAPTIGMVERWTFWIGTWQVYEYGRK